MCCEIINKKIQLCIDNYLKHFFEQLDYNFSKHEAKKTKSIIQPNLTDT